MVVSRAIIRDLYSRERISSMISLVIAVMMIAQMLSPLTGGLLETAFGWRAIFYVITAASLAIAVAIAVTLAGDAPRSPRSGRISRRCRQPAQEPRLHRLCAVPGAGLADHLHLCRRRALYRRDADGPLQRRIWRVVCDHGIRLSDRQSVLRALRAAALAGKTDLVRARAATRRQPARTSSGASPGSIRRRHGCSAPRCW